MHKRRIYVEEETPESEGKVVRFGVSVPADLLREFDEVISQMGMKRSKAIRLAMRNFLTDINWEWQGKDVVGTINILYDHDVRGLDEYLTETQHRFLDVIIFNTHIHLDEENCLLIIVVRGSPQRIKELIDKTSSRKGVKQVRALINRLS
ncbi:MAG: nickel-responsive transcriptional regulator NikR [Candidatus Korarchaeota archaeon]|nr:nickel-responsive transcriptional regulator NikR [Candidatus Korarchaeota archaeon]